MTLRTHRVLVAYSQLHLAPVGLAPVLDPGVDGVVAQTADAGRSLIVLTGIAMGPVVLHVGEAASPPDGDAAWDLQQRLRMDVAEPLLVTAPTLFDAGPPEPVFVPSVPGSYDVTVLARGRRPDREDDVVDPEEEAFEEYAVLLVPGPAPG